MALYIYVKKEKQMVQRRIGQKQLAMQFALGVLGDCKIPQDYVVTNTITKANNTRTMDRVYAQ